MAGIYRLLAERHNWSPQVVADMTPEQQLMYLNPEPNKERLTFSSVEEAQAHLDNQRMTHA